ncbi:MAG: type III-B CRISPR module RAMP protein Cmr6 [Polyangiaceae bacterium]|nr:type III-B CRISPR module RAMP protein Cmr6 [Polyangiaceae bacterium]
MDQRPLYSTSSLAPGAPRPSTAHAGLWYDKFCQWRLTDDKGWGDAEIQKGEWVKSAASRVGDADLLQEHVTRRQRLLAALGGHAVCVKTAARFVTGLGYRHPVENGFAWHPVLGTPYLPGSGLKGVARTWAVLLAATDEEHKHIVRIFGPRGEGKDHAEGTVIFVEAIPRNPVQLVAEVMTPHYGPYYQAKRADEAPGDYHNPTPIPFLAVEKGTAFLAGILPRSPSDADDAKQACAWLLEALQEIGAGAKTATGYGRFQVDDEAEKAWRANAERERMRLAGPVEQMRHRVAQMSEGQAYRRAVQVFEKGEPTDPAEREALRQALLESRFFTSWRRGQPLDRRECQAGEKKLKQLAAAIEGNR